MNWSKSSITVAGFAIGSMFLMSPAYAASQKDGHKVSARHDAWHLVWADNFNGKEGSAPNPHKWAYNLGRGPNDSGWGNNELEYYTNSTKNAFLDGKGHLIIRAMKQSKGGGQYTSARLLSRYSWNYGKIVVRAKLPQGGQGIWPAIWMMPTKSVYGGWPSSGEIDIMEMIGSNPKMVYGTIHFGSSQSPAQAGDSYAISNTGFHTYTLIWRPNSIQWYVDSHLYETQNTSDWYTPAAPSPAPFNQPFHLILNLAVGGNWPGYPDSTVKFPQQMVVDYVHVFQQK